MNTSLSACSSPSSRARFSGRPPRRSPLPRPAERLADLMSRHPCRAFGARPRPRGRVRQGHARRGWPTVPFQRQGVQGVWSSRRARTTAKELKVVFYHQIQPRRAAPPGDEHEAAIAPAPLGGDTARRQVRRCSWTRRRTSTRTSGTSAARRRRVCIAAWVLLRGCRGGGRAGQTCAPRRGGRRSTPATRARMAGTSRPPGDGIHVGRPPPRLTGWCATRPPPGTSSAWRRRRARPTAKGAA